MPNLNVRNTGLVRCYQEMLTAEVSGAAEGPFSLPVDRLDGDGWRRMVPKKSALYVPIGTNAEDEIGNWQLQIGIPFAEGEEYTDLSDDGSKVVKAVLSLAYGTFTLGAQTGIAGASLDSDEFVADTLVIVANTAWGDGIEGGMGITITAISPTGDGMAGLLVTDHGPGYWARFLPGLGGSATAESVNAFCLQMT